MTPLELALERTLGGTALRQIQTVKIGIAGAGGLGSNCAFNLVRTGFKKLVVVDFDRVEAGNLNRQFYFDDQVGMVKVDALKANLLRINPELDISVYQRKIDSDNVDGFFGDCQVVVEAFDKPEYKRLIIENYLESDKLIVSVSGLAGVGESDRIITRKIKPNLILIGDCSSAVGAANPPLSPKVNLAAAKQADAILEWVLKENRHGENLADY